MAHLVVVDGDELAPRRIPLEREVVIVGRAPNVDVRIADRKASATHCRIEKTSGGYRIADLESQNGTWLNGQRVRRHALKAGDTIAIGTTLLRFEEERERRARGRKRLLAAKAAEDLEQAFERFLRHAGADDRTRLAERLGERSRTVGAAVTDPDVARLRRLVSWIRRLTNERDTGKLLSLMLDGVVELTGAERGFLLLRDQPSEEQAGEGASRIRVARNFELDALRKPTFKVARGIAHAVLDSGEPLVSTNADADPRIKSFGDTGAFQLRSVVCVPIRAGARLLGSLYLDNRFERGVFGEEDLPFLLSFADQAAVALENARLHEEARRARAEVEQLNKVLRERVEQQELQLEEVKTLYARASEEARTRYAYDAIVGESPVMRELFFLLDRVTDSDVPVHLSGESGSGKELCARAIHFNGPRGKGPFVSENCAAIPETLFESELFGHVRGAFTGAVSDKKGLFRLAHGGTLFLDEIADLPLALQARMLRALQEKVVRPLGGSQPVPVDVRILTASNRDLAEQVRRGGFREDLYHRIHVIEVPVPPLRRRREDIPLLVEHFLARIAGRRGDPAPRALAPAALELFERYAWPGNVRQLENEVLRAHALSDDEIRPEHLSEGVRFGSAASGDPALGTPLKEAVRLASESVERAMIRDALRAEQGNKSAVARRLGISRPTLDAKMEALKIPRFPA